MENRFAEPVTTFVVDDVQASLAFYVDVFGFAKNFVVGNPPNFACVYRGDLMLYLQASALTDRPRGSGAVSVTVGDARAIHEELLGRGHEDMGVPEKRPYGLVDFVVKDPDGNAITIANLIAAPTATKTSSASTETVVQAVGDFHAGFGRLGQLRKAVRMEWHRGIPVLATDERRGFLVTASPDGLIDKLADVPRPYEVDVFPGSDGALLQKWIDHGYRPRYVEYLMQVDLDQQRGDPVEWTLTRASTPEELKRMSAAKERGRDYPPVLLDDPDLFTFYLSDGDEVLAGANLLLLRERGAAYLEDVFTASARRGQGVGAALLRGMLAFAREQAMSRCTLIAVPDAKAFYEPLGFQVVSEFHGLLRM